MHKPLIISDINKIKRRGWVCPQVRIPYASSARIFESELLGLAIFHGAEPSRQWVVNSEAAIFPLAVFRGTGAFCRKGVPEEKC